MLSWHSFNGNTSFNRQRGIIICGIFGVISKKKYGFLPKDIQIFDEMMYVGALRGMDSTGVITVEKNGDFHIDKAGVPSFEFMPEYEKSVSKLNALNCGVAMIGHNRKSTIGKIGDDTAHPFVINDTFAMVHNGTLYNHSKLAETTVDSEALAHVIERALNGDDHTLKHLEDELKEVNGAYAVVGYNQATHKIHMIRNSQRPMCLAETAESYFFASEGNMLQWILNRNGVKPTSLISVAEDMWLTFSFDSEGDASLAMDKLDTKKFYIPVTTGTTTKVGAVITKGSNVEVSKNEYKKLKKNLVGKTLEFYVVDYVEKNLFQTPGNDYLIMAEADGLEIKHIIKGCMSVGDRGIMNSIETIDWYLLSGKVENMEYNMQSKTVEIFVSHIDKVTPSYNYTGTLENETTTSC